MLHKYTNVNGKLPDAQLVPAGFETPEEAMEGKALQWEQKWYNKAINIGDTTQLFM